MSTIILDVKGEYNPISFLSENELFKFHHISKSATIERFFAGLISVGIATIWKHFRSHVFVYVSKLKKVIANEIL